MPYDARALKVMIASPSDVLAERLIARECIHDWNDLHAEERRTVLLPVGWDTHSSPSMDAPPQEVINGQVLEGCDLLLGIFWTRLGTPTADARSGTVEEIERHIARGGKAMLYFSDTPVVPSAIDPTQYAAVQRFFQECRQGALVETYSSHADFREKLRRNLVQTVVRYFPTSGSTLPVTGPAPAAAPPTPRVPDLSHEARVLVYQASQDPHATIARHRYFNNQMFVQANQHKYPKPPNETDNRARAIWWSAVDELAALGLIRAVGRKGEVFELTGEGFEVAEALGPQDEDR